MQILTPAQCRAARALLNWSQPELAQRAGMHVQTISSFESEGGTPTKTTIEKIAGALEYGGVEFLPNSGVCHRSQNIRFYEGREGNNTFFDDVYNVVCEGADDLCVSNVSESTFDGWSPDKGIEHKKRMTKHKLENPSFEMRILVKSGDMYFPASAYAQYKWVEPDQFKNVPFYVYGDRLAIVMQRQKNFYVCVIHNRDVADAYRAQFNLAWDAAKEPPKG